MRSIRSIIHSAMTGQVYRSFLNLSKDLLIYGLSSSLGPLAGIVTIPIIVSSVSTSDYGSMDVINAMITLCIVFVGMGISPGLWRYFYTVVENSFEERQKQVSTAFWVTLITGSGITILISLASYWLSAWQLRTPDYAFTIILASVNMLMVAILNISLSFNRLLGQAGKFLAVNLTYIVVYVPLLIVLVGEKQLGLNGVFLAQGGGNLVASLISLFYARSMIRWKFSLAWSRKMISFGMPLLVGALLNALILTVNRFFLNIQMGTEQVAVFALAMKIAAIMSIVLQAFTLAWQPFVYSRINKPGAFSQFPRALNFYLIGMLACGAVLAVFSREIFLVIAPQTYIAGAGLVGLLLLSEVISRTTYITDIGNVYFKKMYFNTIGLVLSLIVNILLNVLLIPPYGPWGSAAARVIGSFVLAGVTWFFSARQMPLPWKPWFSLLIVTSYMGLLWISALIPGYENFFTTIFVKCGLVGSYLAVLGVFGYLNIKATKEKVVSSPIILP